jgi:hypothetical protein
MNKNEQVFIFGNKKLNHILHKLAIQLSSYIASSSKSIVGTVAHKFSQH